jgi:single-strand DNA-binding protein
MSSYTIEGRVLSVGQTEQKTEKLSIRKFIIDDEAPEYANLFEFQLANAKTELADKIKTGERVRVHFNLKGRGWTSPSGEVKYFTSLDAWRIESLDVQQQEPQPKQQQQPAQAPIETDLPF